MSFLRHREIYPSDGGVIDSDHAPAHRLDEFPAGYSLAVRTPALSASASPTASEYAVQSSYRSIVFQRTVNSVLTACVRQGGRPNCVPESYEHEPCTSAGSDRRRRSASAYEGISRRSV